MPKNNRTLFNLEIDPETSRKLEEVARSMDRSRSVAVRWMIRQTWEEMKLQQRIAITEQGLAAIEAAPERG